MYKKNELNDLFKILKIRPENIDLYIQALTHKTFVNENKNFVSYEKLEFVGDSILQMFSSLYIFDKFSNENEGTLSIIRSNLVSSESLAKIIKEKKINKFLICSNNIDELKNNNKICSDLFESLLAAIYIDLGPREAKRFLDKFLFKQLKNVNTEGSNLKDPKTRLQELLQPLFKNPIQYICEKKDNVWMCKVVCLENTYGKGKGKTKKEAEIKSAKDALDKLKTK